MAQSRAEPYRGQIWAARLPGEAAGHKILIVSRNVPELGSVVGALITHNPGNPATHVQLDADCGVDDDSHANVTDLYTVRKGDLRGTRPAGIASVPTMDKITALMASYFVVEARHVQGGQEAL